MSIASRNNYLKELCDSLALKWPENRLHNIVCHGHSVPSGYFATPFVNTFAAYPHLLHVMIKERFPYAVLNVIVTAVGGENSQTGARRFKAEVLCHNPELITIDYALNDRQLTLAESEAAWRSMIEQALEGGVKVILLTPSWEQSYFAGGEQWYMVEEHAVQVRFLAREYGVGLSDTFLEFQKYIDAGGALQDLLCHVNHPSGRGHELIATELARWFLAR